MNSISSQLIPVLPASQAERVRTAGKFFTADTRKFFLNGVSYGPFAPNAAEQPFPDDPQLDRDFAHIRALGFNVVRIYDLPSPSVLSAAARHGLRVMAGIPWAEHVDFLSDPILCKEIEEQVITAATKLAGEPAVAAILIGNEIEKTLVRWLRPRWVRDFLERLIRLGKAAAPEVLFSYATYPSTEYLMPRNADFFAINVYLEQREAWERYLRRLQNLAGNKPLVIAEFGMDVRSHDEHAQAVMMRWQRESLLQAGVAGNVWFAYTDDWHRGGAPVEGWQFGLVDRERRPRAASEIASGLPMELTTAADGPLISAIVCTRNGSATLRDCLTALGRQSYPNKEIIVIDDGSTDETPEVARAFPFVRYLRQEPGGLSVARNFGAREAAGQILAFTDDDCIPEVDWLARLSIALADPLWLAAGGPNIPPLPRNRTEALVAAAPGAPTHVLLNDEEAEHLPGCNLAIRKSALLAIGGFRAEFTTAGDDVDVCWRLREAGGKLRFVPGAMVWHHRRFTMRSYLRQQAGYGAAEALLMRHHSSRFGPLGGARWRGAIYGDGAGLHDPTEGAIFHGPFGFAPFQAVYPQGIAAWWDLFAGVLWIALALLALVLGLPAAAAFLFAASWGAAWLRKKQSSHPTAPQDVTEHLQLWLLCWLQPIVREWARLMGMIRLGSRPSLHYSLPEIVIPERPGKQSVRVAVESFWSDDGTGREQWLAAMKELFAEKKTVYREDDGWRGFDLELAPRSPFCWAFTSVTEYHGGNRRLSRVAVLQRISKRGAVVMVATLGALYFVMTRMTLLSDLRGEVVLPAIVLTILAVTWLRSRAHCIHLVHQAAERIGLRRLSRADEHARRRTSPLAAAGEACQNV